MRLPLLPILAVLLAAPAATAQTTLVDFEFYPGPDGILGTGDDVPIVAPGLFVQQTLQITNEFDSVGLNFAGPVQDSTEILLNGSFSPPPGSSPVNLLASSSPYSIEGNFSHDVYDLSMWAGIGFGATVDVYAYDAGGNVVDSALSVTSQYITLTSATPIARFEVLLVAAVVAIDDLEFDSAPTGPQLAITGNCPGPGNLSFQNGTPSGPAYVGWSLTNASWVLPTSACAGMMLDIASPTLALVLTLDGSGAASVPVNLPNGACNRVHVQAADFATCTPTNVVSL